MKAKKIIFDDGSPPQTFCTMEVFNLVKKNYELAVIKSTDEMTVYHAFKKGVRGTWVGTRGLGLDLYSDV